MLSVSSSSEYGLKVGSGVRNPSLFSCRTSSRVKLLAILEGFSSLLVQALLLAEHVYDQVDPFTNRTTPIYTVLRVAKVAKTGYFVQVAFELNDGRWRTILNDKFDGAE